MQQVQEQRTGWCSPCAKTYDQQSNHKGYEITQSSNGQQVNCQHQARLWSYTHSHSLTKTSSSLSSSSSSSSSFFNPISTLTNANTRKYKCKRLKVTYKIHVQSHKNITKINTRNARQSLAYRRSDWSSAIQYLPYGAKIVKIGPVDPEILRLRANKSGTTQNWLPWNVLWGIGKYGSRKLAQIPSIWWKDRENRSSRYSDSFAHSKKNKENQKCEANLAYSPLGAAV